MLPGTLILTLVYLGAALVSALCAPIIGRRRDVPGGRPLAWMVVAASFWALCDAFELQAVGVEAKRLVSQVQYLGVVATGPLFLQGALALAGLRRRLTRRLLVAMWSVPVATLLVAWTSAWHGWLWRDITLSEGPLNLAIYHYGWWFWVLAAHQYLLLGLGAAVLLAAARRVRPPFRASLRVVVVAVALPWLGNVAYTFKIGPWPGVNWLSVGLVLTGVVLAWDAWRGGLFDVLPRAREALFESMSEGVLVLDRTDGVLYANAAGREALEAAGGGGLGEILGRVAAEAGPSADWQGEVRLGGEDRGRWLDVRASLLRDRWARVAGRLLVARDVSRRKELEEERERLIEDLQEALASVRTLEGLLPLCAGCGKVRDDQGYWSRIEEYLRQRASVEFTHGLCPGCIASLYPELGRPPPPVP